MNSILKLATKFETLIRKASLEDIEAQIRVEFHRLYQDLARNNALSKLHEMLYKGIKRVWGPQLSLDDIHHILNSYGFALYDSKQNGFHYQAILDNITRLKKLFEERDRLIVQQPTDLDEFDF